MSITGVTHSAIASTQVSASIRRAADDDGDGKTGAAALNDGDAVAHAAARQVAQQRTSAPAASPDATPVKAGHVDVRVR
jgi:uncharacterized protein with PIN domain